MMRVEEEIAEIERSILRRAERIVLRLRRDYSHDVAISILCARMDKALSNEEVEAKMAELAICTNAVINRFMRRRT